MIKTTTSANAPAVEFLANAKRSGKTRFIGLTAKNARLLARVLKVVEVDSVMAAHQFNPVFRNAVEFLFSTAQDRGVGVVIGAPLMKGWLAVPQNAWRESPPDWMDETFKASYFRFLDIHADAGIPMADLCIRWMLSEKRQQSIVVGFSNLREVELNLSAALRGTTPGRPQRCDRGDWDRSSPHLSRADTDLMARQKTRRITQCQWIFRKRRSKFW